MTARLCLLAGPKFSGKSRFVERFAEALRAGGVAVSGFVQRGSFDAGGRKEGYDLVGLASGARRPIARRAESNRGWVFDRDAFAAAMGEIRPGTLVFLDEVGPLELDGGGHAAAVERAISSAKASIAVVREELAKDAARWLAERADVVTVRYEPRREEEAIAGDIRRALGLQSVRSHR